MTVGTNNSENDRLIRLEKQRQLRHVVILGAGASLAAFPNGDARGRKIPLMKDLINVLDLQDDIAKSGYDMNLGFESLYSSIYVKDPDNPLLKIISTRVEKYFNDLKLPDYPTIYDFLILLLRDKDAIFTFNWDPFLAEAYSRNYGKSMPRIFHLHGNVRAGYCTTCRRTGPIGKRCTACDKRFEPSRLLYPVAKKDYSGDPFISTQWDQARLWLDAAFIVTIFGYSAPDTDKDAVEVFTNSWKKRLAHKEIAHHVEIVDIKSHDEIAQRWENFVIKDHYSMPEDIFHSYLFEFPRRSCEAFYARMLEGNWDISPFPLAKNFAALREERPNGFQARLAELHIYEGDN